MSRKFFVSRLFPRQTHGCKPRLCAVWLKGAPTNAKSTKMPRMTSGTISVCREASGGRKLSWWCLGPLRAKEHSTLVTQGSCECLSERRQWNRFPERLRPEAMKSLSLVLYLSSQIFRTIDSIHEWVWFRFSSSNKTQPNLVVKAEWGDKVTHVDCSTKQYVSNPRHEHDNGSKKYC